MIIESAAEPRSAQHAVRAAAPLHGLSVEVRQAGAGEARALVGGQAIRGVARAGYRDRTWFDLPPVEPFEAVLFRA